ncbi:MAG: DHH family phosphoesterase [Cyanosarcina radialis HA8281-LM2]|jgi:single-stranded-DNA-specific exonuclease|nr:DHH family phosphoesterase [Cyanosarcina radialis HA8281-LM2]
MPSPPSQPLQWQIQLSVQPPASFLQAVRKSAPGLDGRYAAQLLWQRGIQDEEKLAGYLNPDSYRPASPFDFGQEMSRAVERLQQARDRGEIVAIWGDFDADGITATSVLWEGLGQFFPQSGEMGRWGEGERGGILNSELLYYIPNRLTESHGLNRQGIDRLKQLGTTLIVTCDTGSTNISEIEYAQQLGIDVIVTDHHTLPPDRPPVTAIINPRYLPADHQMFHLSGVAVGYKLVEALYQTLPDVPQQPLEDLLDLVAIGLVADLVQLSGDCRYLAQRGIERLQRQVQQRTRPGVARLLELCQRNGDRPTDISFGIGPRINAVSRIHGDASFCVELLTSRDAQRCRQLAEETELANARRKSLQKNVTEQVKVKLGQLDLSTTSVIVLCDEQWSGGVLGLVAGQVAQEYGRPTILLSTETVGGEGERARGREGEESLNSKLRIPNSELRLARGSARSVNKIDLYELVNSQAHLLHRFGGHPFAAGLSLPVENIPLFTEAINQQLRLLSLKNGALTTPTIQADLVCTVKELGRDLFRELKLLEPCGMGNPFPKLLIQNCWFEKAWNRNIQDWTGKKIQYIKTSFEICDRSTDKSFPGIWWGHYRDELPQGNCDAIVELDYNNYEKRTEVRLVAVRPSLENAQFSTSTTSDWILDWRDRSENSNLLEESGVSGSTLLVKECPHSWHDLQAWFRRAMQTHQKLAIAYPPPEPLPPLQIWQQLVGIAKYLSRTGKSATLIQLQQKLELLPYTIDLGIQALEDLGFAIEFQDAERFTVSYANPNRGLFNPSTDRFLAAVREEQFLYKYFSLVPLATIQSMVHQLSYEL